MATRRAENRKKSSRAAKSSKKKRPVAKKRPATRTKTLPKKKSAKPKGKLSKEAEAKRKAADATTRAEKAARRRKLEHYRQLLEAKHRSLLQAYSASKSNTLIEDRDGTEDYIDYAVSSYDRDFTLSLTEMDRRQLRLVEEALVRLRRQEYGNCQHCNAVIPEKRLDVEPWARFCIRCQELDEQDLLEPPDFEPEGEEETEEELEFDEEEEVVVEEDSDAEIVPDDDGAEVEEEDDIDL